MRGGPATSSFQAAAAFQKVSPADQPLRGLEIVRLEHEHRFLVGEEHVVAVEADLLGIERRPASQELRRALARSFAQWKDNDRTAHDVLLSESGSQMLRELRDDARLGDARDADRRPAAPLEHECLPARHPIGGGPSDSDVQEITEVDRLRGGAVRPGALQGEPAGEQLQATGASPARPAAR